jgi:hypothetical protein
MGGILIGMLKWTAFFPKIIFFFEFYFFQILLFYFLLFLKKILQIKKKPQYPLNKQINSTFRFYTFTKTISACYTPI